MLRSLFLQNFAIVEFLELDFQSKFSVITGETGAGKSILLDALDLLLGNKADYGKIKSGADEAVLMAVFDILMLSELQDYLVSNGLANQEGELFIKRIITRGGKSKNYLNGQLVPLSQLKEVGLFLINIHGQNSHHFLLSESNQRKLLDQYAKNENLLTSVANTFTQWNQAQKKLLMAQKKYKQTISELEILAWKNQELSELNPQEGEWEILSQTYDEMSHRNEMIKIAQQIEENINQDRGIQEIIAVALSQLKEFSSVEKLFQESVEILQSVEAELIEVSSNMRAIYSRTEIDQKELEQIVARMSALKSMAKKYQTAVENLPEKWRAIKKMLQQIEESNDLDFLTKQVEKFESEYQLQAFNLTVKRQEAAEKLSCEITKIMHTLSMNGAQFEIELENCHPSQYGNEQIVFKVATHLGSELRPIHKVVSGGELSRISLAIQVIMSQYNQVPTLIFDEVDTGIGGKVADVVGCYLKKISQKHQILAVTHLPQVAVYGDEHYQVKKIIKNQQTVSQILQLQPKERIQEIARMLGGGMTTDLTLKHAQELLELASQSE